MHRGRCQQHNARTHDFNRIHDCCGRQNCVTACSSAAAWKLRLAIFSFKLAERAHDTAAEH